MFTLKLFLILDLDKATNLTFETDNRTALIAFTLSRGDFDEINLTCIAQDQHCSNLTTVLTNTTENCSTCTSILIIPIMRGVQYKCQAFTIKQNFTNIPSDELELII